MKNQLAGRMRMIERAEENFIEWHAMVVLNVEREGTRLIRDEFRCSLVKAWEPVRTGFGNTKHRPYGCSPDGRWIEL